MKPMRFKAWAVVEANGDPAWHPADIWSSTPPRPRVYLDEKDIKLEDGERLEPVEVVITPVAQAAKRGKRC